MESNSISSQISKDPSRKDELLAEAVIHSDQADKFTTEAKDLLKEITDISSTFPNVASASTPIGKDEADNTVISEHHIELQTQGKPHYEIMEELELGMQEESGILAGSRHVIYSGKGAELVRAIELYLLDMNMKNGFKLITPPVLVNSEMLYNTGQLPKFKDDLYELKNGQYLIPTAEVPLTNLVTGKMLKEEELPIRYTSLTNCFRLEAGSAGMDTRGIIRLHQFRKVELVSIINPKDHETELNFLLKTATSILDNLKISYRIVELCTGDLGFSAEKTFDIEV
ncbi:MAG: serine--tRNA ligase [Tenericutes bacterium]|nr:MAG: serine--tRNA ligase [Mycoplasmatota bacterium]